MLLIADLAVVLTIAGVAAWLCQRAGLSVVVGYLIAGSIIGPFTPPFALVTDLGRVQTLAEIGLVFLIFSIGMSLSLSRLRRLGVSVVLAALISSILLLNICRTVGWAMGWSLTASLFLAGMMMCSSSAIISKVLEELNLTHERPGQMALGLTVMEDLVAITMLTFLTSFAAYGQGGSGSWLGTLGGVGSFVVLLALISLLLVPKLLAYLSKDAAPEVRTLVVAGLLLSVAWLAAQGGYSLALGAFVFGAIVGSTRFKVDVERAFDGMRQLFGAVFFVAIGMLVDFRLLADTWPQVLVLAGVALLLRPVASSIGFMAVGNSSRDSIQAGLSVTPLGEFTFVIAQLGVSTGVLETSAYPAAVGGALLTALAAPLLTRNAESLSDRLVRAEPPLVSKWVGFYNGFLQRLRGQRTAGMLWKLTAKRFLQVGIQMLFISGLLLFVRPLYATARQGVGAEGFWAVAFPFLFWSLFGVLLLAPLIAIWRNVSALAMIFAEAATQETRRKRLFRPVLETALRIVAGLVLGGWLVSLLPTGWSLIGAAGLVLAVLVLVAYVFWRRFVKLHSRLEIELREQLQRASHVTSASSWSGFLPRQTTDWDLELDEITLPNDTTHGGKTLGQLSIRQRFGCSVVGIDRQGYGIANPGAETVVYPNDRLLLLGEHDQLVRAGRELLALGPGSEARAGFDELTMETVQVPVDSTVAGRPLAELDLLRRMGVQIGGIRRKGRQQLSPSGGEKVMAGDELLVLGNPAQIQEFIQSVMRVGTRSSGEPGE